MFFIYIEATLARKQLHRGIFAPKILKILKTVKNGEKRDFLPRKKINRFQKRAGFSRAKMGGLA